MKDEIKPELKSKKIVEKPKTPKKSVSIPKDRLIIRIIILNIVNVLLVIALVVLLNRLPIAAKEVKKLRSEKVAMQETSDVAILEVEIKKSKEKIQEIDSVFIGEVGFLEFLSSMEAIQAEGVMQEFNFPVTRPVKDSAGDLGFPVSILFVGTQGQINDYIQRVSSLPFLLKTVSANIEISSGSDVITLRHSVFLYINEKFKN